MARTVVVGIDGSSSALRAARWAAREARRRSAQLHLLHCDVKSLVVVPDMPVVPPRQTLLESVREEAEESLRLAKEQVGEVAPDVVVETEFRMEAPASGLVEQSRRADVVVLGSRGLGGFTGLLIGSVAIAVAAHARCPVAVVRGEHEPDQTEPVVVGVSGSAHDAAALGYAFELAAAREVPLRAVHAWHSLAWDEARLRNRIDEGWAAVQSDEERLLTEVLAGWSEERPDVVVQRFAPLNKPARALLTHAEQAQLVVVGARGRGGFTGLVLGSTSQQLVQHSPCPVVIAR
ncbi:nucleotide-binding universal stress UspA family protein [Saccharopolyspora gloriosae]|uniref:Nucleotide-binding universal stress UspA family protein n=1 Tax=Saccharopolyspora gloriosae TaxID=455344 RepID=A0A840NEH1_9PSEU|nr:universal stress protein [Saccharopolyspora gloriosae]MBB5070004.1 nucleotide-binding universal stress UspA family protein [Saccharopolyspora gloriosae]